MGKLQYSGVVRNLYVDNFKAGGKYENNDKGKTYVARSAAMFGDVNGLIENVHMKTVDIIGYEYSAGLVCNANNSAEIKDCSVSNLTIRYNDPDDVNADSYIGGIGAKLTDSRITHCYVQGIDITVDETKSTYGIGGIVGYASNSVIDTAYAEGEIISRAQKVGGIVGHYYCTSAAVACMKNMWAKVDIICYTDVAGALVGQTNITQDRISETNNFTGLGVGNVYLSNLDSVNCSQTIGANIGKNATFYGTTEQLINGRAGAGYQGKEDCVRGLLTYEQLMNNASNSYFEVVGFEKVYSMAGTQDGYLPKMYYTDSSKGLLPNQQNIVLDELKDVDIEITGVIHNDVDRIVAVEIRNPNNYKITSIFIRDLKYHFVDMTAGQANYPNAVSIDKASDYDNGITRIYLQYDPEQTQDYFLDSYVMDNITFYPVDESGLDNSLLSSSIPLTSVRSIPIFSRIDVMLCKDIPSVGEWNNIPIRENNGHVYENYRITGELDFANVQPALNLKIGRLISDNNNRTIKNIELKGADMHLLARLNSGFKGLNFDNVTILSSGVGCVGIVGVSNGTIIDCDFSNIKITPLSNNTDEVGIIGHSNGGRFENITLDNISINDGRRTSIDYVGALAGKIPDRSILKNITASNITVVGSAAYTGGVIGATEMSDVENIFLSDLTVTGAGNYTGGFVGHLGYTSNASGKVIKNVEIIGTPTFDANGRCVSSTTNIKGNNYVGGIAGHTYQKVGSAYVSTQQDPNLNVDGIVVSGLQNYGGALGGTYTNMYHLTVKDTLVKTREDAFKATSAYSNVGGIFGTTNQATGRGLLADNVTVDVDNTNCVGGIGGYYRQNVQHSYVNNCYIKADKSSSYTETLSEIGGFAGKYDNNMNYCGVLNTIVSAPKYTNVGGILGRFAVNLTQGYNLGNSFYLAEYDTQKESQYNTNNGDRYTAAALGEYYVEGLTNVGGIVGYQNSGYIHSSYSNANVIAGNNGYAGGISGMYCNEYTTSLSNGKVVYSYAVTGMYRNYFAGTVDAPNGYAGGAIGRTGILNREQGTGDDKKNGNRIKGVNANTNEVDKTYGNIIIADTISGGSNGTNAFAGDDTTYVFIGRDNRIWDKTILNNGTDMYAGAVMYKGSYVYDYWSALTSDNKIIEASPAKINKLLVFKSIDLDGSYNDGMNKYHRIPVVFYRSAGWGLTWLNNVNADYARRDNSYWRFSIGDIPVDGGGTRGLKDSFEQTGENTGTYLPQVRAATNRKYNADSVIKMQESVARLPLPRDKGLARTIDTGTGYSMRMREATYGIVYASDIDKINVEFSNDLVDNGYFTLKAGDKVIANKVISQRTYTFSYPYNQNITFEYGFLEDVSLDETEILEATNYEELESILLGPDDLRTDIMVYHNDYYYISEDGLVSSVGTWIGDFIHVMNGKLLDRDGNIWNVESRKKVGTVSTVALKEKSSPLWQFKYGSIGIDTYAKYSAIESEYDYIYRNSQIFVVNDELYVVDGSLETVKTDILIYNLNGEIYQTVLGNDGMMVDMLQDDWNIPEEVDNQAIVRISNTLNASVPYVLVEYNNGGIIGYNYATGDILFDNSISNPVSLLDYAVNFFSGDKESQYANISNTYLANKDLSNQIHSSADLEKIIGNSSGDIISGNEYDYNSAPAQGNQNLADSNYAQAGDGIIGTGDSSVGIGNDGEKPNENDITSDENDSEADGSNVVTDGEGNTESEDATKNNLDENSNKHNDSSKENDKDLSNEESNDEQGDNSLENEEETETEDEEKTNENDEKTETSLEKEEGDVNSEDSNEDNPKLPKPEEEKEVGSGEFMTVYNNETGVYEIISVVDYLTVDAYISENHKFGVKDLSKQVSGYAQSTVDVNQERGIIMYIVPIFIIFGITGIIVLYVKRKERKA